MKIPAPPPTYRVPRWTKTSRANISGVRHRHKSDDPDAVLDQDASWRWLRTYYAEHINAPGLTPDERITAEPEFEPLLHGLRATITADAPPEQLNPAHELLRTGISLLLGHASPDKYRPVFRALVGLWAGRDPTFPLTVHREDGGYHVSGSYGGDYTSKLRIVPLLPNPLGHRTPMRIDLFYAAPLFEAYRAWLMAAPEPVFQAARAAAAKLRAAMKAGGTPNQRATASHLAYAFSRDTTWATEDAEELLAALAANRQAPVGIYDRILAGLTDPALALRLAEQHGLAFGRDLGARAFDVVESLGGDAAPVLETLLAQGRWHSLAKRPVASALKLAQTA